MVTGLSGVTGVTALSRAVAVCRIGQELVPVPRRPSVESHVLERVMKRELAMRNLVQVIFALIIIFMVFLGDCNSYFSI